MNPQERLSILKEHSTFETVQQLQSNVEFFVKHNNLSKSALKVLRLITSYAKNYLGACWLKVRTITDKLGLSDSTVRRATRALEKLGIIGKVRTSREKRGGDGANVYVIKKIDNRGDDIPQMTEGEGTKNIEETSIQNNNSESKYVSSKTDLKKDIVNTNTVEYFDHSFVSDYVDKDFVRLVKVYFDDASVIEKLWQRVKLVERGSTISLSFDTISEAVRILVRKAKERKIRGDIFGYFFGTLKKKIQIALDKVEYVNQNMNQSQQSIKFGMKHSFYDKYIQEQEGDLIGLSHNFYDSY